MHLRTDVAVLRMVCAKAETFEKLAAIARAELAKFSGDAEIVCGPITTGGRGSIEKNLEVFEAVIGRMLRKGRPLFNQMPYETQLFALRRVWRPQESWMARSWYEPVLEEFYLPLFTAGRIKRAWFIPGWKSSKGAQWERDMLPRHNRVSLVDLTPAWVDEALAGAS